MGAAIVHRMDALAGRVSILRSGDALPHTPA
jgi:hypothetical protein